MKGPFGFDRAVQGREGAILRETSIVERCRFSWPIVYCTLNTVRGSPSALLKTNPHGPSRMIPAFRIDHVCFLNNLGAISWGDLFLSRPIITSLLTLANPLPMLIADCFLLFALLFAFCCLLFSSCLIRTIAKARS